MIRLQRRYSANAYNCIHPNCMYMCVCVCVCVRYGTGQHDTAQAQVIHSQKQRNNALTLAHAQTIHYISN